MIASRLAFVSVGDVLGDNEHDGIDGQHPGELGHFEAGMFGRITVTAAP